MPQHYSLYQVWYSSSRQFILKQNKMMQLETHYNQGHQLYAPLIILLFVINQFILPIIIITSTMNKKSISKIVEHPNFNQTLFTSAIAVAQSCQQLLAKLDNLDSSQKILVKQKQQSLQTAFKNAINTFGKFCGVQKAPLQTPIDHSLQIFEAISDTIQTSVQKYRQNSKKGKLQKQKTQKFVKEFQRPQDQYPNIKPARFQFHSHQKDLTHIRTDINIIKSRPIQQPLIYIDTQQKLENMINELINQPQISVDVQHSSKSYEGLTCLIQISSRHKDYIVDVFPIWSALPNLKRIIENPYIIKVMHGAEMDTKWLQRDFNIHIHNLFDTYRASRTLGLPKLSYAYLLSHYCNMSTDKSFQTADWRKRPLSAEMVHYARLDTHYLLQIFDKMRADIHQKSLTMGLNPNDVLVEVYEASHQVTRNQVELFNFLKREFMQTLRKDHKQSEYQLFQYIFNKFNQIAKQSDLSFDQMITHKVERLVISKLKELLLIRQPQIVNAKIDKFISDLSQLEFKVYLKPHILQIKQFLDSYFVKRAHFTKKQTKKSKAKVAHIEDQNFQKENRNKKHETLQVTFREYETKTYQNMNFNPFSMLSFEPIASFLAKRIGIAPKAEGSAEIESNNDEMQIEEEQGESIEQKEQSNEEAVIEFKRINPNVIYTVEEAEAVEQQYKPRKKRKQHQYEKKIKQKSGNIYQLLQE